MSMTVEEFDEWVTQPQQDDKLYEYIGGEVIEVPSNAYASKISSKFIVRIGTFVEAHDLGHVTGEAGGYMVDGQRYAPDVAFVSKTRQTELDARGYNHIPPDLAVEVDFPSTIQSLYQIQIKLWHYQQAGTIVWVVYPEERTVIVHTPGQPPKIYGVDDTLDGGDVLPGFTLPLNSIFPESTS